MVFFATSAAPSKQTNFYVSAALLVLLSLVSPSVVATTYNISALVPYANGNSSSVTGQAFKWGNWYGLSMGSIVSATGTYNDVTGTLNATFTLELRPNFLSASTAEGIPGTTRTLVLQASGFSFGPSAQHPGSDLQQTIATGTFALSGGDVHRGPEILVPEGTYDITFDPTKFHPNEVGGPNTLTSLVQGNKLLDLWGGGFFQNDANFQLGTDFRLQLTPVPLPAAVLLFGSGLLTLFGIRKRKRHNATTA